MSEYDDCTVAEIERDIRKAEEEIRDLKFKLEAERQRCDEISAECRRLRILLRKALCGLESADTRDEGWNSQATAFLDEAWQVFTATGGRDE